MMNRIITIFMVVFITLVLVGCSSVKVADKFDGQNVSKNGTQSANIVSSNHGWYLFCWVPIIAGDLKNLDSCYWFRDTVTVDGVYNVLTKKSSELVAKKKTINVRSEEKWASEPISGFLLWNKGVAVSGNAVK